MTSEKRREYQRQWRLKHQRPIKRGAATYVCPRCGKTDSADGSVRAASGLCLDCWCHDENRKSNKALKRRIQEILGGTQDEDADYHRLSLVERGAEAMARAIGDGSTKRAAEKYRRDERRDEYLHRPEVAERRRALARARYDANPPSDEQKERKRQAYRRYYLAHREEIRKKQKEWYDRLTPEQKAKRAEYYRKWHQARKQQKGEQE